MRLIATVVYVLPDYDELRKTFDGYVNSFYNGATFTPIMSCKNVVRATRDVEFTYVDMFNRPSTDEVLDEMKMFGLRPALPEEMLSFNNAYPDEMMRYPIVALGSVAIVKGLSFSAFVDGIYGKRNFHLGVVESVWERRCRFLAVPIESA
jgi:hypothetical protein